MDWISDPSVGAWLRERLDESYDTMHGVVPRGFPAYARIFHPASVGEVPVTWADAAAAFGTVMHPLAQWQRLVRTPEGEDWRARTAPDGREFDAPLEGEMTPAMLAPLAALLTAHTTTPDAGVAAIWAGYGDLLGSYRADPSGRFFGGTDDAARSDSEPGIAPDPQAAAHQQMLERSIHDPFNNVFRKPTWQPGILSDEISQGPQLELPGREYVLFSASPVAFADPGWVLDAPWRDRPAEAHGFPPAAQHPNILWPADHAWTMVSEIDFDSTVVAGSADLIAAICADPLLEAEPVPVNADLSWQADEINR